jgi:deoxycytidylate deaminase
MINPSLVKSEGWIYLREVSIIGYGGCLMRPEWDSCFMNIAYAISERSTCDRAFVGCVLVLEKHILTI